MNLAARLCLWILGIDGRRPTWAQELDDVFIGVEVDVYWTGLRTHHCESAAAQAKGRGTASAAKELHAQRRP